MAEPVFRLATEVDVGNVQGNIKSVDFESINRLENAFGREAFTLTEALDMTGDRQSIRRLRNVRLIISAEK
ncbi:hypothetical protein LCGC14_0422060 [marine sediment metagenome]|uniref:Uncharacterized protein n=1 Tax=marine sediment metagenome TaxID=412755 RepID=A0A0F9VCL5_9ZZZZ